MNNLPCLGDSRGLFNGAIDQNGGEVFKRCAKTHVEETKTIQQATIELTDPWGTSRLKQIYRDR